MYNHKGIRSLILSLSILILSACSAKPALFLDPSLNESNSGILYIYKPKKEWVGLAVDLRVYIDENYIGSLRPGYSVSARVKPGLRIIEVKPYFALIQDGTIAKRSIEINI